MEEKNINTQPTLSADASVNPNAVNPASVASMQQQAAARTSSVSDFPLVDSAVNAEADTAAESAGAGVKVDGNINEFLPLEEKIVAMFRTIYDPEIPVNIYDLGMVYRIDVKEGVVDVQMTLTAPNCPAADFIVEDVRQKLESIAEVKAVNIDLVFDPAWDQSMMSDEAKLELGFM
jgi:FeS assembly SUF system protein